ncbi:hypothetical protein MNBD_ALPHA11-1062 [hydrothermal vent metagenome]|uniref:Uncharacterized protein n=1 Tax=hydrothermal vent metagenome TaxID=652676 RepID=A0A3B0TMA9_9ZZZZ
MIREHCACAKSFEFFWLGGFYTKNTPKCKGALNAKEIKLVSKGKIAT